MICANWNRWDFSGRRPRFAFRAPMQVLVLADNEDDESKAAVFPAAFARLRNSMNQLAALIAPA